MITALCSASEERLLIALDDGSIYWMDINEKITTGQLRFADGTAIVHIDIDHMQKKLYAVMYKKGILRYYLRSFIISV